MQAMSWVVRSPGEPMVSEPRELQLEPGQVVVEVAGCGVCHTDLGFYYEGVPTRHPLPLTLGHEISGIVVAAGEGAEDWVDRAVIVPAVMPCGTCKACQAGRGSICPKQIFPGNDVHGGFGSHVVVPALGLCPVPDLKDEGRNPAGLDLASLSVIADAVTTPLQAIKRSGLERGDLAVFVGAGGVGGFGVQIARAYGAQVVAIDVDERRLAMAGEHGAELTLRADELSFKDIKGAVKGFAKEHGIPSWRQNIFETSGAPQGQETAYGLLVHGAYLSLVGFTPAKVSVRLSNLMAFDARAEGNWGCLPEHYPEAVDLCLRGDVAVKPFIEHRPLSSINETFRDLHEHKVLRRVVLVPDA